MPTITPVITYTVRRDTGRGMTVSADWTRRYTKTYRAITNDPHIGPKQVVAACPEGIGFYYQSGNLDPGWTGTPTSGHPTQYFQADGQYEADKGSWVQEIGVAPEGPEDGLNWLVTVEYAPITPVVEDPISRAAVVTWDYVAIDEIVDEDLDGNAVLNSAHDYFDPPITRNLYLSVARVQRNEATFDYVFAKSMLDGLNQAQFLEAGDALHWKITKMATTSVVAKSFKFDGTAFTYWPVDYELQYNPNGWKREILNQGMRQLNAAGTGWEPILTKGQPASTPQLLDAAGRALAPSGTPIYKQFKVLPEVDYTLLNFSGIDFGRGPIP